MQEPVIRSIPIKFKGCYFKKRENNDSNNFTRIWALASCFTNSRIDNVDIDMSTVVDQVHPETEGEQN